MVGSNNIGARLLRDEDERRDMKGTSGVVSALAKEEDGSSSEGTLVSAVGAGGDNVDCTEAERAVGVTGKGSSSLHVLVSWRAWVVGHYNGGRHREPLI